MKFFIKEFFTEEIYNKNLIFCDVKYTTFFIIRF